jgi:excisionase family DNA binding protein
MQEQRTEKIGREWLGMREITEYADVSERTVRGWIHAPVDALPAVRVGGKILVKRSELDAWLERRRVTPLAKIDLDVIVKDVLQAAANGR